MSRVLTERERWFKDRVGKIVYRNKDGCSCSVCEQVYNIGLLLTDEYHAQYVSEIEASYNADGFPLKYFDTKEEVAEFEKQIESTTSHTSSQQ